jgi:hypothetical protein
MTVPFNNQFPAPRPSPYKKVLIVIGCGILMAAGGCGLFLGTLNHSNVSGFFALVFGIGVLTVIVGLILLIVRAVLESQRR